MRGLLHICRCLKRERPRLISALVYSSVRSIIEFLFLTGMFGGDVEGAMFESEHAIRWAIKRAGYFRVEPGFAFRFQDFGFG